MITVNLPLSSFLGILFGQFGDPEYPAQVTTPLLGERYVVKLLPYAIGALFKELDPDEELFHIELVEPGKQAEVWLKKDWKESLTRREKLKESLNLEKAELSLARDIYIKIYPIILAKSHGQEEWSRELAQNIIKMRNATLVPEFLRALGIDSIMAEYSNNENHPTTNP